MSGAYTPPDVPCAGCDEPTPYAVGDDASYGEELNTPIGRCYRRTHRKRSCVEASRAKVQGTPVKRGADGDPLDDEEETQDELLPTTTGEQP